VRDAVLDPLRGRSGPRSRCARESARRSSAAGGPFGRRMCTPREGGRWTPARPLASVAMSQLTNRRTLVFMMLSVDDSKFLTGGFDHVSSASEAALVFGVIAVPAGTLWAGRTWWAVARPAGMRGRRIRSGTPTGHGGTVTPARFRAGRISRSAAPAAGSIRSRRGSESSGRRVHDRARSWC